MKRFFSKIALSSVAACTLPRFRRTARFHQKAALPDSRLCVNFSCGEIFFAAFGASAMARRFLSNAEPRSIAARKAARPGSGEERAGRDSAQQVPNLKKQAAFSSLPAQPTKKAPQARYGPWENLSSVGNQIKRGRRCRVCLPETFCRTQSHESGSPAPAGSSPGRIGAAAGSRRGRRWNLFL